MRCTSERCWLDLSDPHLVTRQLAGGIPVELEYFGTALAAGRVGGQDRDSLAIGTPRDEYYSNVEIGPVQLGYGLFQGWSVEDSDAAQNLYPWVGLATGPQTAPIHFGSAMAIGDFDGDGSGDLAVGAPIWSDSPFLTTGAVQILYGAIFSSGFETQNTYYWTEP